MKPERGVVVRIVLIDPPPGVDYGIQRGSGNQYDTVFTQRPKAARAQVVFDVPVTARDTRADGRPNFTSPFAQGPPDDRFLYVDIGTYAGQADTPWSRRMKVPLGGISWALIEQAARTGRAIETRIPGTARDGGPTCASTAALQSAWTLVAR